MRMFNSGIIYFDYKISWGIDTGLLYLSVEILICFFHLTVSLITPILSWSILNQDNSFINLC
jgi:hypothetical protein